MGFEGDIPKAIPASKKSIGFTPYLFETLMIHMNDKFETDSIVHEIGKPKRGSMPCQHPGGVPDPIVGIIDYVNYINHIQAE
jgi:hypothetical protein